MDIYISSYNENKTVTKYNVNENGNIVKTFDISLNGYPSYIKKDNQYLYASIKKSEDGNIGGIIRLKENEKFTIDNNYESDYSFTHLYIDENYVIGASYHQGLIQIFNKENGTSFIKKYQNSKIHHVGYIDKIKKFYAVDLANNCIYFYKVGNGFIYDENTVFLAENDSPRHICYKSMNRYIYIINENSSTIKVIDLENDFKIIQEITTIKQFNQNNKSAAIMIDEKGEYLYCSNRGCDNIVIYKINKETGFLKYLFSIDDLCKTPRDFFIKNNEIFILNQDSHKMLVLRLDFNRKTYSIRNCVYIENPVCIELC